jgi:anti-anti-sigma regulatory factor
MVIETSREVVYVSGSLCANQWPVIKTTACLVYEEYPGGVVIDFSGVRYLSEMGEHTFIEAAADIERHRLPFFLTKLPHRAKSLLSFAESDFAYEEANRLRLPRDLNLETWWDRIWGNA